MEILSESATCGDWQLRFDASEPCGGRTEGPWRRVFDAGGGALWVQEPVNGWRGSPWLEVRQVAEGASGGEAEPAVAWLQGELYGGDTEIATAVLESISGSFAGDLDGHFVLVGWDGRRWHVVTNRLGTLHAYRHDAPGGSFGSSFSLVAQASRRELNDEALAAWCSHGFFPDDRTHWRDVRILRPGMHYRIESSGRAFRATRTWQWRWQPDTERSFEETADSFGHLLAQVMDELTAEGRLAIPISGGLDSRSTVAALGRRRCEEKRIWSYSYGWSPTSIEISIAREIAALRSLRFEPRVIGPYLLDDLGRVCSFLEGMQDVTLPRQVAVQPLLQRDSDSVVAAHWGDVWLDDLGLTTARDSEASLDQRLLAEALRRFRRPGREWLLKHLVSPRIADPERTADAWVRDGLADYGHLEDPDYRLKAFKTDHWSFRWTTASLRAFQAAAFPRLPFYDRRLVDFFATVPSGYLAGRRLQIESLKRSAPDLAGVTWQKTGVNLFTNPAGLSARLQRTAAKIARRWHARPEVDRNWEVQFAGAYFDRLQSVLESSPSLNHLVAREPLRRLLREFRSTRDRERGYAVSMLLTMSAWLDRS